MTREGGFILLLIVFIIYQIIQILCLPIVIPLVCCLQIKRGIVGNLKERCGFVPKTNNQKVVWIHAVSVGEVLATQELINLIKKRIPGVICYLTVGTISGKKIAEEQIHADVISFFPYDFLPCMLTAYARIKPQAIIIIESELWPNFITLAHAKKIPLFLLNARIKQNSAISRAPLRWFFKDLFNCFTMIFAQSKRDDHAFQNIGVPASKITMLGNLKAFNVIAKKNEYLKKEALHKPPFQTLLVGSMHPGELDIYLNVYKTLKKEYPLLKLVIAPRHFTWQETLIQKVSQINKNFFVWTDTQPLLHNFEETMNTHDILLVCKLGELFTLYPYAILFALGGTFVPIGGHNLLEPAAWAVPAIVGPYHQNCQDIVDRLEALNAIVKVETEEQLLKRIRHLLGDPTLLHTIGDKSHAWVMQEAAYVENKLELLIKKISKN